MIDPDFYETPAPFNWEQFVFIFGIVAIFVIAAGQERRGRKKLACALIALIPLAFLLLYLKYQPRLL